MFRIEVSVKTGFPDPEGDRLEKDIRLNAVEWVESISLGGRSILYQLPSTAEDAY